MNVFEFAMRMEQDGEAFYRQLAANSSNAGLRRIFTTLAEEEVVHYATFKKLFEKTAATAVESNVLAKARNIFAEMKASGGYAVADDVEQADAYRQAMAAEKEAYTFYEKKAGEVDAPEEKRILQAFAREERRHYRLLEHVLEFVSRPDSWMESAEYVRLEEY